jgi:hypothetical protein
MTRRIRVHQLRIGLSLDGTRDQQINRIRQKICGKKMAVWQAMALSFCQRFFCRLLPILSAHIRVIRGENCFLLSTFIAAVGRAD